MKTVELHDEQTLMHKVGIVPSFWRVSGWWRKWGATRRGCSSRHIRLDHKLTRRLLGSRRKKMLKKENCLEESITGCPRWDEWHFALRTPFGEAPWIPSQSSNSSWFCWSSMVINSFYSYIKETSHHKIEDSLSMLLLEGHWKELFDSDGRSCSREPVIQKSNETIFLTETILGDACLCSSNVQIQSFFLSIAEYS